MNGPDLTLAPPLGNALSSRAETGARRTDGEEGFGVYVHWPFCLSKCPYCDFNSHVRARGVDEARYARACAAEIAHWAAPTGPRHVTSVFFGGGTPSLMSPDTVAAILEAIAAAWSLAGDAEVTLEANPSSVEAGRFDGYARAGINRVSLGVQALDDADLKALGRLHTASEALAAVAVAQERFDRVSIDLIYARPRQSLAAWRAELARALALGLGHMSLYQLTIEPGTPFALLHAAGRLVPPEEEAARALYETTQEMMEGAGLPAYEVSNHARPGEACRHNLLYWRAGEWAGIGPGAHGRLRLGGRRHALATERVPEAWLDAVERRGHGLVGCEALSPADAGEEYLLMGLRLTEGIDLARYQRLSGRALAEDRMALLERDGLVTRGGGRLRATPEGRLLLNSLIAELAGSTED